MSEPNHSEILFFYLISFLDHFDNEYTEEKCSNFLLNKQKKLLQYTFCTKEDIKTVLDFLHKVKNNQAKYSISQPSSEDFFKKLNNAGVDFKDHEYNSDFQFEVIIHTSKNCNEVCPKCTISEIKSKSLLDAVEIFEELLNSTIKAKLQSLHIRFA